MWNRVKWVAREGLKVGSLWKWSSKVDSSQDCRKIDKWVWSNRSKFRSGTKSEAGNIKHSFEADRGNGPRIDKTNSVGSRVERRSRKRICRVVRVNVWKDRKDTSLRLLKEKLKQKHS